MLAIEYNHNLNLVHCAIKIKQRMRKGLRYYNRQQTELWDSFKQSLEQGSPDTSYITQS